jgi:hypothetical protein
MKYILIVWRLGGYGTAIRAILGFVCENLGGVLGEVVSQQKAL